MDNEFQNIQALNRALGRCDSLRISKDKCSMRDLLITSDLLCYWLSNHLVPFWCAYGYDSGSKTWFDELDLSGAPVAVPRRVLVQARQAAVLAIMSRFDAFNVPEERLEAALQIILQRAIGPTGRVNHSLSSDGRKIFDVAGDLYDAEFVLFALAELAKTLGPTNQINKAIDSVFFHAVQNNRHPMGGLWESLEPRPHGSRSQNPHMHMVEAFLSLYEVTGNKKYLDESKAIIDFVLTCGRPNKLNAIQELWRSDGQSDESVIKIEIEPGHQFEWSFLIYRYSQLSGDQYTEIVSLLHDIGERCGVEPHSGFIYELVDERGDGASNTSRFWTHCERLRSQLRISEGNLISTPLEILQSIENILAFFDPKDMITLHERYDKDFHRVLGNVRASSVYHLVTSIDCFRRTCRVI